MEWQQTPKGILLGSQVSDCFAPVSGLAVIEFGLAEVAALVSSLAFLPDGILI